MLNLILRRTTACHNKPGYYQRYYLFHGSAPPAHSPKTARESCRAKLNDLNQRVQGRPTAVEHRRGKVVRQPRFDGRERENFKHALFALAFFSRRQDRELPGAISPGLLGLSASSLRSIALRDGFSVSNALLLGQSLPAFTLLANNPHPALFL